MLARHNPSGTACFVTLARRGLLLFALGAPWWSLGTLFGYLAACGLVALVVAILRWAHARQRPGMPRRDAR